VKKQIYIGILSCFGLLWGYDALSLNSGDENQESAVVKPMGRKRKAHEDLTAEARANVEKNSVGWSLPAIIRNKEMPLQSRLDVARRIIDNISKAQKEIDYNSDIMGYLSPCDFDYQCARYRQEKNSKTLEQYEKQEDRAWPSLLKILRDPQHSVKDKLKVVEIYFWREINEQEEQKRDFPEMIQAMHEFIQHPETSEEDRQDVADFVFKRGPPSQKITLFRSLREIVGDSEKSIAHRIAMAELMCRYYSFYGTEDCYQPNDPWACSPLLGIVQNGTAPAAHRLKIAPFVFQNGSEPQKNEVCDTLKEMAYNTQISTEDRLQAVVLFLGEKQSIQVSVALQQRLLQEANILMTAFHDIFHITTLLAAQNPDLWETALTQEFAVANQILPTGPAYEIHAYAKKAHGPVWDFLDKTLEGTPLIHFTPAHEAVNAWIRENFPEEQQSGLMEALKNGLTQGHGPSFLRKAYTFVKMRCPEKIGIFMNGFVEESRTAYAGRENPTSCIKGIKERILTGLRGIDPQLDKLCEPAEKIATAMAFMTNCNFGENEQQLQWMVARLKGLRVKADTTPEEAGSLFQGYAVEYIQGLSLGDGEAGYLDQIKEMSRTIVEHYETKLRPLLC